MTHTLRALAGLLVLAGCNPVAYVPAPIPAAPQNAGLRAGLGVNMLGSQAVAHASVAPDEGMAFYAQGHFASTGSDVEANDYTIRGGDLGVAVARPLGPSTVLDLGVALGRDAIDATDSSYDIGCCSTSRMPVELQAERFSGHLGVFFQDGPRSAERFRIGPALRVTYLVVRDEAVQAQTGAEAGGTGVFVEPALRAGFVAGAVEFQTQAGMSVLAGGDLFDHYSSIPLFFGGVATVRLDRLGR